MARFVRSIFRQGLPNLLLLLVAGSTAARAQEALPSQLAGTWRIVRMLPTKNSSCWQGANALVGTTLTYRANGMRWQGGEVTLQGVVTRTVSAQDFEKETASAWGTPLKLADLHIQSPRVLEVDLQHEDADITGSTTEVPGDSILVAGRNTIVVSACGSFFEATRTSAPGVRSGTTNTVADNRSDPAVRLAKPVSVPAQRR